MSPAAHGCARAGEDERELDRSIRCCKGAERWRAGRSRGGLETFGRLATRMLAVLPCGSPALGADST